MLVRKASNGIRDTVEEVFNVFLPNSFSGATVLVKPNMVGPSTPDLGHTTHPELVEAVVNACRDRSAKVWVGDNPGGIKSNSRHVAGACKARLHLDARSMDNFARAVCDVFQVRPPDLHLIDGITTIEGNGPCHGGQVRKLDRLLTGADPLAVDTVMARMMGVDPVLLPVQREARERGMGEFEPSQIEVEGDFLVIPDFRMPVTFLSSPADPETQEQIDRLYPQDMGRIRTTIKPERDGEKCINCGVCEDNCPAKSISFNPDFHIDDTCIACYCCVELCTEGAMVVPDAEVYRRY